ncbi:GDP-mannose transporter [Starmerella bacillaris]|uniref:GDP-mannose transporter n=1 Tax=Starmerella bacillaris TaxID=1247836 RepID=A0AAV5RHP2_STABA|nr:GDP-mannose transporter [Starmerella bacillaris]
MSDTSLVNSPAAAIGAYCISSIVMTLGNKFVLSGKNFNLNCVVLAVQSLSCLAVIHVLKALGFVSFRKYSNADAKKWFPIAALLVAMIYTASKAIQYLSVPVFTIFKNLTIILIAYGEVLWFGGVVTPMIFFSFMLIVLSSVVAAWSDVTASAGQSINWIGYLWMFSNCFSQAAFVLVLRKRIKVLGFKDMDTMFYNNLLSIPILLVVSVLFEDWSPENVLKNFPEENRFSVIMMMVITGLLSVGISYCSGWCVRVTSSTTYSMVGALNKLPIAVFGLLFFDPVITFMKVFSIVLGFSAGLVYSYAKIQQQKQKETTLPK